MMGGGVGDAGPAACPPFSPPPPPLSQHPLMAAALPHPYHLPAMASAAAAAAATTRGPPPPGQEHDRRAAAARPPPPPSSLLAAADGASSEGRKLFVGNVRADAAEAELLRHFAAVGAVSSVKIMYNSRKMHHQDRAQWRSRQYGFVIYERGADARAAVAAFDGRAVPGLSKDGGEGLVVQLARPPSLDRGAWGGGAGGLERRRDPGEPAQQPW